MTNCTRTQNKEINAELSIRIISVEVESPFDSLFGRSNDKLYSHTQKNKNKKNKETNDELSIRIILVEVELPFDSLYERFIFGNYKFS